MGLFRWPSERDVRISEQLGRCASEPVMPTVNLWLLDTAAYVDPLYNEPDPLYHSSVAEPDERTVGDSSHTFAGPYTVRVVLKFKEDEGRASEATELGSRYRLNAQCWIPREELRKQSMIEAASEDAIRLPDEGDILEIYPDGVKQEVWKDKYGVGPWFFRIKITSFGQQVGGSNHWIELFVDGEFVTDFDPARLINKQSESAHGPVVMLPPIK